MLWLIVTLHEGHICLASDNVLWLSAWPVCSVRLSPIVLGLVHTGHSQVCGPTVLMQGSDVSKPILVVNAPCQCNICCQSVICSKQQHAVAHGIRPGSYHGTAVREEGMQGKVQWQLALVAWDPTSCRVSGPGSSDPQAATRSAGSCS